MIRIKSSHTVTPSAPTPNPKFFSLCEQIKLRTHAPLLFLYKPQSSSSTFFNLALHTLRLSLSQALSIYYPLAGRLSWAEGGAARWELNCNAKGALLLGASCDELSLDDLGDFVPTGLVSRLVPTIDYGAPIEETPLMAVQVTEFRCGGVALGVALCRAASDGTAAMGVMCTWAKLARGMGLGAEMEFPCHDRSVLDSRRVLGSKLNHDHSQFRSPSPWLGGLGGDKRGAAVEVVKLTGEQVKRLKTIAKPNMANDTINQDPNARPNYSTFEVVTGHLWRCVSKARRDDRDVANGYNQPTRLSTLVNCRGRMRPPLPANYSGNSAFPTVTATHTFGDLIGKPLGFAAGEVRAALERVSDEFVGSALDYIADVEDMDTVRYNFHYPAKSVGGDYKGDPNLVVVSWMNFPYKDVDFGWGGPSYFGPGFMDSIGKAFLMNRADGDGVVVAICLEKTHMDAFNKFFYEDIDVAFPTSKL